MAKRTAEEMIGAMDKIRGVKSKAEIEASKPHVSDLGLTRERKFKGGFIYNDPSPDPKAIWLAEREDIMSKDKNLQWNMPKWIEQIIWNELIATRENAVDAFKETCIKNSGKKELSKNMEKRHILQGDARVQDYERWVYITHRKAIEAYEKTIEEAYNTTYADVSKLPE
jgi:hypothetical protein